jgi:hypothetical protein
VKYKINERATHSKSKKVGDISGRTNELKEGYQPRTISAKDEKGDLLAYSQQHFE